MSRMSLPSKYVSGELRAGLRGAASPRADPSSHPLQMPLEASACRTPDGAIPRDGLRLVSLCEGRRKHRPRNPWSPRSRCWPQHSVLENVIQGSASSTPGPVVPELLRVPFDSRHLFKRDENSNLLIPLFDRKKKYEKDEFSDSFKWICSHKTMDVHLKAYRAGVLSAGLGHISEP